MSDRGEAVSSSSARPAFSRGADSNVGPIWRLLLGGSKTSATEPWRAAGVPAGPRPGSRRRKPPRLRALAGPAATTGKPDRPVVLGIDVRARSEGAANRTRRGAHSSPGLQRDPSLYGRARSRAAPSFVLRAQCDPRPPCRRTALAWAISGLMTLPRAAPSASSGSNALSRARRRPDRPWPRRNGIGLTCEYRRADESRKTPYPALHSSFGWRVPEARPGWVDRVEPPSPAESLGTGARDRVGLRWGIARCERETVAIGTETQKQQRRVRGVADARRSSPGPSPAQAAVRGLEPRGRALEAPQVAPTRLVPSALRSGPWSPSRSSSGRD